MNYSVRQWAWAAAIDGHRFGGRAWKLVPEFALLTEGEREMVMASRSYRRDKGPFGELDELGDASAYAAQILGVRR